MTAAGELVRELAALVRWYRHGRPIDGLPKYQHGQRADSLLTRATAFLGGQAGGGERGYSAAEVRAIWLGAMESQIKSPEIRERLKAEALRRYPEKPREGKP